MICPVSVALSPHSDGHLSGAQYLRLHFQILIDNIYSASLFFIEPRMLSRRGYCDAQAQEFPRGRLLDATWLTIRNKTQS